MLPRPTCDPLMSHEKKVLDEIANEPEGNMLQVDMASGGS